MQTKLITNYADKNYAFKVVNYQDPDDYYSNSSAHIPLHADEDGNVFFFLPANIPFEDEKNHYFKAYLNPSQGDSNIPYMYYDYFGGNEFYIPPSESMQIISGVTREFVNQFINHFINPYSKATHEDSDIGLMIPSYPMELIGALDPKFPIARNAIFLNAFEQVVNSNFNDESSPIPILPCLQISNYLSLSVKHVYSLDLSRDPVFAFPLPFVFTYASEDSILSGLLQEIRSYTPPPPNNTVCTYCTYDNEEGSHISSSYKFANVVSGFIHCSHPQVNSDFAPCAFYNRETSCPVYKEATEQIASNTIDNNSDKSFKLDLVKLVTKDKSNYYKIINTDTQDHTHSFAVPENDEEGNPVDHLEHANSVYQEVLSSYISHDSSSDDNSKQNSSYILSLVG